MRVSELVTIDQINSWNDGDIITIKAGTGTGKSYFIKNNLYAIAKRDNNKILFLIHRSNCANQFQEEILRDNKEKTIHIRTYQFIEYLIKNDLTFSLGQYKYIVCDEFHYFMSDAAFNKTTDISLNLILNQANSIRIFMSATGEYVHKYLNNIKKLDTIDYKLDSDYSHIKVLTFYNKDTTLDIFMGLAIKSKEKAIFFIQSAKKAYEFYSKYKEYCLFNCSKSNKDYYKYVDENKINQMLKDEKFNELILITTTCFDAGVNIHDKELKHIVCDVKDIGTIIQCVGRKRLSKDDNELNLYVKSITNQQLGGIETQLKKKIEMAKYLKDHTPEEYVNKYKRELDYSHMVYDEINDDNTITKKINLMMYFKCIVDMAEINKMKDLKQYGFCKALCLKLGFYNEEGYEYRLIEEELENNNLVTYLNSLIEKKLFKPEQNELIDKIDLKVNGRKQRSYKKLNEGLNMINLPYIIIPKKSGNERYWIVEKIDN
jgi:superfamily II DNA or RNA helicase